MVFDLFTPLQRRIWPDLAIWSSRRHYYGLNTTRFAAQCVMVRWRNSCFSELLSLCQRGACEISDLLGRRSPTPCFCTSMSPLVKEASIELVDFKRTFEVILAESLIILGNERVQSSKFQDHATFMWCHFSIGFFWGQILRTKYQSCGRKCFRSREVPERVQIKF